MVSQSIGDLKPLAVRLLEARMVVASTGAGVSKESGVPTFREKDGLWNKFRPEELANVDAFLSNPERVWEWYNWRRELMSKVEPNPGHYALVEMEKMLNGFTLITQNVDNLHRVAGSENVIELHGNIRRNKCHTCGKQVEEGWMDVSEGQLPRCECGGLIRPDVVWFGEMLPPDAIEAAWSATAECEVLFSLGTSSVVYPAAALPFEAKKAGAYVVEINPQPTELTSSADIVIQMPTGEALPMIVQAIRECEGDGE